MLIREGVDRPVDADRRLVLLLPAVAGAVNASAFREFGSFPANMTGNLSLLSARLSAAVWPAAGFSAGVLLLFVAGAALAAIFVDAGRARLRAIYALGILLEAATLATLAAAAPLLGRGARGVVVILVLAGVMGFQNALSTRISRARVRTTHVTGVATDLGLALGSMARRGAPADEAARVRLGAEINALTILSFGAGGLLGLLAYDRLGTGLLAVIAAPLASIALLAMLRGTAPL